MRSRKKTKKLVAGDSAFERLEARQLLSGTGLTDAVYHGVPAVNLGGGDGPANSMVVYASATTPNYTFTNTNDAFIYAGGTNASTSSFLGADAAGAASTDSANVGDTIFDAEGYFQTPTAGDSGTYTLTLPPTGGAANSVDDLVAVFVGGNGTPGSGTLVGSSGWQSANAGLPGAGSNPFQFTVPAAPNTGATASIPIEIVYGNGFGGAYLSTAGGSPATGVLIQDPNSVQVTTYNTTATNEPLPAAPSLTDTTANQGNNTVKLSWGTATMASTYSVSRYVTSAGSGTAVQLISGLKATPYGADAQVNDPVTYTDTTAIDGTNYSYFVTAVNQAGSTPSNTVTDTPSQVMISGLTDSVYHANNAYSSQRQPIPNPNSPFGGPSGPTLAGLNGLDTYVGAHTPNYTFINTNDQFSYGGGSGATTPNFLGSDAAGTATTDPANVNNTIFDAKGYFQAPANDGGTYTVTVGTADDIVGVYIGGNGISGSGTLVADNGWQGATNGGLPGAVGTITLPAGPGGGVADIPIEVLYSNGNGGAFLNGVTVQDPNSSIISTFQTSLGASFFPPTEPAPAGPVVTPTVGSNTVLLSWSAVPLAASYSVFRYLASSPSSTAVQLGTSSSATSYTDTTAMNGTTYDYYVVATNANGSNQSSTLTETPEPNATGPVTLLNATRNTSTSVQLTWTAPPLGMDYTVTRSTTSGGTQTVLTPTPITATSFTDTTAVAGTSYYYTVTSTDTMGGHPSPTDVVFSGAGDGWWGAYYTSIDADPGGTGGVKPFTADDTYAAPLGQYGGFARIDPTISVLNNTPPGWNSIQTNNGGSASNDFAVRWGGYVEAPVTGFYSFAVNDIDDREQIFVYDTTNLTNGSPTPVNITLAENPAHVMSGFGDTYAAPVVDATTTGSGASETGGYQFVAGQQYLIQVDYNQGYGGLAANLSWAASSSAANAVADTYDVLPAQAVPTNDVVAPTPAFETTDAEGFINGNPGGVESQDQPYYTLNATGGDETVSLTWNNVGADSYNLYRSTSASGPFTELNSSPIAAPANGAPLSYTDTNGLSNGTTYYYILTGVDDSGETPVDLTTGVTSGLTASATTVAAAPAVPTGVTAAMTNASTTGIQGEVSFPAVPLASSYTVQRSTSGSGPFATVTGGTFTTTGSTVMFTDSSPTLTASQNYFYQVIANGQSLSSAPSTPVETNIAGPALATVGNVEVDVIAASQSGTVTSIPNFGLQGGSFATVGSDPVSSGAVTDANSVTHTAYQFDSTNSATSNFNSPSDLNGNSSRSIEVWVNNPTITGIEQTMVSWSHRGGNPDGSNMSFSYGSQYGVGLWGGEYDMQFGQANTPAGAAATPAAPTANNWHNLTFTYDGTNEDLYVDGALYITQPVGTTNAVTGLETFAGFPVNLAAQNSSTVSSTFTAAINGGVDLGSVRIESGALSGANVATNFGIGVQGQYVVSTLPSWLSDPAGHDTWTGGTLTVNDPSTIIADPGTDEPTIVDSTGNVLKIKPSVSDVDVHVGGIMLSNSSEVDVVSVGGSRSHNNHNVLVIGTLGSAADPTISVDSTSKIDLEDNDMIVHTGSSDTGSVVNNGFGGWGEHQAGGTELGIVQKLANTGRNIAPGGVFDGTWDGNGLTSSAAGSVDASQGFEQNVLEVAMNSDMFLGGPDQNNATWTVGGATEHLGPNDILVKYTYNGDLNMEGAVNGDAATIFSSFFNGQANTGNAGLPPSNNEMGTDAAYGDLNNDGNVDGNDATIFSSFFDNGLGAGGATTNAGLL